jgi:hypothetical protein
VTRALSPEAIEQGTGRSWDDWLDFFESIGASDLTHRQIVEAAAGLGAPPWWRQMVTVTYEQQIGRRVPGQDGDGTFTVSTSRTVVASMDEALARWVAVAGGRTDHSGVGVTRGPDESRTDRWRYWRCGLADGSRVVVNISAKGPDKSVLSVQHEHLEDADLVDHWRSYWKALLASA